MIDLAISKLKDALEKCYEAGDVDEIADDISEAIQMLLYTEEYQYTEGN